MSLDAAFPDRVERRACAGFSLVEIIVVVGLLSFIMLGLLVMFNQTQRVFRSGMTQTDVLEGGRLVTDMMRRELLQMRPSHDFNAVNFFVQRPRVKPLEQDLPGQPVIERTNLLQQLYFLTRENQTWTGFGYVVADPDSGGFATNLGTLYRFERSTNALQSASGLFSAFDLARHTPKQLSRVLDGVVHFKVRAYNTNGVWITGNFKPGVNIVVQPDNYATGEIRYYNFYSDAVPAFVEFEIGVLEDRALQRARSLPAGPVRAKYLKENLAGRVHLFRTRVPIQNVDTAAYR